MNYFAFAPLDANVSVLGFGCAPVGSRYGRRESLRALGFAFDEGVNYLDVARSYGYGDAERIVGQFIRGKRDRVFVATKFGIDPPKSSPASRLAKAVARNAFRVAPGLRLFAGRSLGRQFSRPCVDRAQMTRSVETSLRQLNTDRIDVLIIHDCTPEAVADDDLFHGLEALVNTGKVRCLGASGDQAVVAEALHRRPMLRVAQSRHRLFAPSTDRVSCGAQSASIAYSPFGGREGMARLREMVRRIQRDDAAPHELRRKMRAAPEEEALAELALGSARGPGVADVVITAMFAREHAQANIRASGSAPLSSSDLAYLRGLASIVGPPAT